MSLGARISRAEAKVGDVVLWHDAQATAAETGESAESIFAEERAILEKYQHLERRLPGGKVDIEPMLRAMAQGEGFDYKELALDVKRSLRRYQARKTRRRT